MMRYNHYYQDKFDPKNFQCDYTGPGEQGVFSRRKSAYLNSNIQETTMQKIKKIGMVTVRLTEMQMQYLQSLVDGGQAPKGLPAAIQYVINQTIITKK